MTTEFMNEAKLNAAILSVKNENLHDPMIRDAKTFFQNETMLLGTTPFIVKDIGRSYEEGIQPVEGGAWVLFGAFVTIVGVGAVWTLWNIREAKIDKAIADYNARGGTLTKNQERKGRSNARSKIPL